MYVRDARNRDEVWLLDHIEEMGLDDVAFRSRDYVIAVDENSNERAGFGRIRIHKGEDPVCELTGIGVLDGWRGQGVGAHVVQRLLRNAEAEGFEEVFSITDQPEYLEQFGFDRIDPEDLPEKMTDRLAQKREGVSEDVVALLIAIEEFEVPATLSKRFKDAAEQAPEEEPEETPEDFGIDPEDATYKYDTGS